MMEAKWNTVCWTMYVKWKTVEGVKCCTWSEMLWMEWNAVFGVKCCVWSEMLSMEWNAVEEGKCCWVVKSCTLSEMLYRELNGQRTYFLEESEISQKEQDDIIDGEKCLLNLWWLQWHFGCSYITFSSPRI